MNLNKFYKRFHLNDEIVKKTGFNPYYPVIQSALDDFVIIDGKKFINLASNNYLGIANDKRIKQAAIGAIEKYGISACATPIASGYSDLYMKVCNKLSAFLELEDTIIYPSCYQANNGLFSTICSKDDVVLVDHYAHSSLIEGIKSAGCKIRPFLHNDIDNLENNIKKSGNYRQIFVVTESVFSTEGSIAPFREIVALCEKYNALPIIDDSHGIGVIGKNGKGILEYSKSNNFQGIYTASLGKSLANAGGIISGKKDFIDYLKYYNPHLIYSTVIPPPMLAGIEMALEIIKNEFAALSQKMWNYKKMLTTALLQTGFNLTDSAAPIISIKAGNSEETILLSKKLYDNNILCTPFIYPSVPRNDGKVRLIANVKLKETTVKKVIDVFMKLLLHI
ncbi:MAG: pyridoxal phosphate-dependent aminotransferase family protein [Bacteroidia bacterium]|nr:pyridoxal phosphate-dependent aminotransferase family protein [Bacteroidia bacterium]